jgi:hypothetical protein
MTKPDLSPCDACLPSEEYISFFYFGYNIGMSLHFWMMNTPARDSCLTHLNKVRFRAIEADHCVP